MESNRKAFIMSAIVGVFAMVLVKVYVDQQEATFQKQYGEEVQVLVATKNLNEMEEITRDSVTIRKIPAQFKQPDAIMADEVQDLFENNVSPVAAAPISQNEQIQLSKVLYDDPRDRLAKKVSTGKRAISVPVNDQYGVGRLVKPGDKVDVISPVRYTDKDVDRIEIKTVLQNVLVLATGERMNNSVPRILNQDPFSGRVRSKSLSGERNFSTVTLEVEPRDAQKIAFLATQGGTVYLVLRNPMDDDVVEPLYTTTSEEVLGSSSKFVRDSRSNSRRSPSGE